MPTALTIEEHGEGIGDAWTVLRDNAARAGLGAPVPTCPGWTVRALVAHQGMVHRWAAGCLRGERADDDACADVEREGLASPDLLAWLDEGAKDLLSTLAFAPADLDVWFFLKDSPGPRQGWARRQCHETTIHAVDAMAAARGAVPPAAETWIHAELAADGVDELLMGFVPRRRSGLELPDPGPSSSARPTPGRRGRCAPATGGPRPAWANPPRARPPTWSSRAPRPRSTSPSGTAATRSPAPTRRCSSAGVRTCRCSGSGERSSTGTSSRIGR